MVKDMDALETVRGEAGGGVLPLPQVQPGGDVGRHRQVERDDQRILNEVRFGIGKGSVPGVKVGSDGLGLFHHVHVGHHIVGSLAGDDAVLHTGAQKGVAGAPVARFLIEGVHLGLGVGVVRAPVVGHELIGTRAAHCIQEVIGRPLRDDDLHKVEAIVQYALHLLHYLPQQQYKAKESHCCYLLFLLYP